MTSHQKQSTAKDPALLYKGHGAYFRWEERVAPDLRTRFAIIGAIHLLQDEPCPQEQTLSGMKARLATLDPETEAYTNLETAITTLSDKHDEARGKAYSYIWSRVSRESEDYLVRNYAQAKVECESKSDIRALGKLLRKTHIHLHNQKTMDLEEAIAAIKKLKQPDEAESLSEHITEYARHVKILGTLKTAAALKVWGEDPLVKKDFIIDLLNPEFDRWAAAHNPDDEGDDLEKLVESLKEFNEIELQKAKLRKFIRIDAEFLPARRKARQDAGHHLAATAEPDDADSGSSANSQTDARRGL